MDFLLQIQPGSKRNPNTAFCRSWLSIFEYSLKPLGGILVPGILILRTGTPSQMLLANREHHRNNRCDKYIHKACWLTISGNGGHQYD